jgi:hypothetical protein
MQKEFVPYELALRMKQLGFDNVPCLAIWYNVPELDDYEFFDFSDHFSYQHYETQYYANKGFKDAVLAPTFSQAFRWFTEKYKLHNGIVPYYDYYYYLIKDFINGEEYRSNDLVECTYEEAELACLEKLIEIVEIQE